MASSRLEPGTDDFSLDDLAVGDCWEFGLAVLTEDDILAFGQEYDPLPYHVSRETAAASVFGGLIASLFQTMAVTQRLAVDHFLSKRHVVSGLGIDKVRATAPVRPGAPLRLRVTVLDVKPTSRPERGVLQAEYMTLDVSDPTQPVPVLSMVTTGLWTRRSANFSSADTFSSSDASQAQGTVARDSLASSAGE